MRTGPLACALLLRAVLATLCTDGRGGDSCPDAGEDDEAGLSQLKLRELHKLRQSPDADDLPFESTTSAPAFQSTSAPAAQTTLAFQSTSAPVAQTTSAPAFQSTSAPAAQTTFAPAAQTTSAPAVQTTSSPGACEFLSNLDATLSPGDEAQACVDMIQGPAASAKQTMEALTKFYMSFYTFALIASDPPAGNYSFDPKFADLGIFGGENGGAQADLSKVDLIGDWTSIAESIPTEGNYPVSRWVHPTNSAFTKLRDCHPSIWENGGPNSVRMVPPKVLGDIFQLQLLDREGHGVALDVSAAGDNVTIDGTLEPVVKDKMGYIVKSVDGLPPMQWLIENILESPAMPSGPYCAKSLGGRMNQLIQKLSEMKDGIWYDLGEVGSLSYLSPNNFSVVLSNGEGTANMTWAWKVSLHFNKPWNCTDFQCLVDSAPEQLSAAGAYRQALMKPTQVLNETWDNAALGLAMSPAPPRRKPPSLAGRAGPGTGNSSLPENVFAWLLDPTCNLGYLAFDKRPDGTEFGLFKFTSFETKECAPNATYEDNFSAKMDESWRAFTAEAQSRNVTNLLVDFVGNGGGLVNYAWQFVQMMEPDLPYSKTCGKVNRPIPDAYRMWTGINPLPLAQFMSDDLGPGLKQERMNKLNANPEMLAAVINNTVVLLETLANSMPNNATVIANLSNEVKAPTDQTVENLWKFFHQLFDEGHCSDPFAGDAFAEASDPQYAVAYRFPELEQRGSYTRNFTDKIYDCPSEPPKGLTNPFDDVVFVSDGQCGSSCYLASGTAWAIGRAYSNRSVRFATYGGIGGSIVEAKKTLSPTAFPGGNVNRDGEKIVNGIFVCLMAQIGLVNFIGNEGLAEQLSAVFNEMTSLVPYYAEQLPGFSQSEVYQQAFGPNSPPAEYVFTPTDLYLPAYFHDVSGQNAENWNMTQLHEMHQLAAQAFGN